MPATELALRHGGRPVPNAALLGGFAALSGLITLEAVAHAIREKFAGKVAEGNVAAATEAYDHVKQQMEDLADPYLYGFFEFYMNVRLNKKSTIVKSSDKGSIRFLFTLIQIGCLLSFCVGATKLGNIDDWTTFIILGAILVLFGFIIRISSIIALKRQYTYTVTRIENHELIESGLYKTIRHPGYLGLVIIFLGISTALSNWLSIILMIVPVIIGIMNRIRVEENFLIEQMGQKYADYQKRTKRLIPNIF